MNPTPIETERTVLSPLRVSDAGEMVTVLGDVALYEFTGGEPPTPESLTDRYRRQTAGSGNADETWCNWVIRADDDGRAVGFVQATVVGDSAEVAWVVGVRDQGRGLATEAAAAMCEWLTSHDVRRVEAHVHPRHVASQAVAARIGLVRTHELDDEGEEIWATGKPADR